MINFAKTALGLPITGFQWLQTEPAPHILVIGGVHGDEPEGVVCCRGLLEHFSNHAPKNFNLTLIPEFNPEGVLLKTRGNSNKVDLNRNLPTKDWSPVAATVRYFPGPSAASEKENQFLVHFLKTEKIDVIYSMHSWKPMLNTNGDLPEAQIIAELTGYKIEPDIGYPTPGSLGTYAGLENKIPTLTYEIERDISFDHILRIHVPAMIKGIEHSALTRKK